LGVQLNISTNISNDGNESAVISAFEWEKSLSYADLKIVLDEYDEKRAVQRGDQRYEEDYHCAVGHEGVSCMECSVGYTSSSGFACKKCFQKLAWQYVALVTVILVFFSALSFLVMVTRNADFSGKRGKVVMIGKVLASHMQLVAMAATFPLDWPESIESMFSVFDFASSAGESAVSFACVLAEARANDTAQMSGTEGIFYFQGVAAAALPVICAAFAAMFYSAVGRRKVKKFRDQISKGSIHPTSEEQRQFSQSAFKESKRGFIVAMIVILFVLQPVITRISMRFFTCQKIGEVSYLEADYSVQCWTKEHLLWALGLGISMLIVYAFGIPFTAFTMLYRIKKGNKLDEKRNIYGFLYVGFKVQYYYWEVVIMLRKLFFAFTAVVLRSFGQDIQATVALGFLTICLIIHVKLEPYESGAINLAELFSLIASFYTMFAGLLIFSENINTTARQFLSVTIILVNVAFLTYVSFVVRKPIKRMSKRATSMLMNLKSNSKNSTRLSTIRAPQLETSECAPALETGPFFESRDDQGTDFISKENRDAMTSDVVLDIPAVRTTSEDLAPQ
jgi:hypothetical protein